MKRIWDRLTTKVWEEGYEHGVASAYRQLSKELRHTLKTNTLADFSNEELRLGFEHARHLVVTRLNEIEGN